MSSEISERSTRLPQVWEIGDGPVLIVESDENIGSPKLTEKTHLEISPELGHEEIETGKNINTTKGAYSGVHNKRGVLIVTV